jgi:hypothetical protein
VSWLVVSGSWATFEGVGTLNGEDGYSFLVSLTDGGSPGSKDRARFRVKGSDGGLVFDTQPGDPFDAAPTSRPSAGNVTVHKNTTANSNRR